MKPSIGFDNDVQELYGKGEVSGAYYFIKCRTINRMFRPYIIRLLTVVFEAPAVASVRQGHDIWPAPAGSCPYEHSIIYTVRCVNCGK